MHEHLNARESMLDAIPDSILVVDAEIRLVYANDACVRSLGHDRAEWIGRPVFELVHPDDVHLVVARMATLEGSPIEVRILGGDGMWRRWEVLATQVTDGPAAGGFVVSGRDVSRRHALEVAGDDIGLLRAIVNHSSAMIAIIEPDGTVRSINGAFTRHLGYNPGRVAGTRFESWVAPSQRDWVGLAIGELETSSEFTLDGLMLHTDGSEVLVEFTVTNLVNDPTVCGYLAAGQVADSLRVARQRAEFLASHDPATGLLNRTGFYEAAAPLEQRSARTGEPFGVVLFDIDHLAQINGLYGAEVGDAVIQSVALRLQGLVRGDDVVARYDGDEFAVMSPLPMDGLLSVRERIGLALAEPIVIDGNELRITVSSSLATSHGNVSLRHLVEQCETELCGTLPMLGEANPVTDSPLSERRQIVDELRRALDGDELRLWFQPIVGVDEVSVGFEALLRWHHPVRGVLTPAYFLPLVALAGLSTRVDALVLDQTLDFMTALGQAGRSDLTVHMNVTPHQIGSAGFAERIWAERTARRIDPERLCLEITESDLLRVGPAALENLGRLRRDGVHIAIDDFGTGFSSLAHLLELPVDMLKIDKRFVQGLGADAMASNLVSAIVGLTANVGLECVAEGVETVGQRDFLVQTGCRQLQGWLFDAALPASIAVAKVTGRDFPAGGASGTCQPGSSVISPVRRGTQPVRWRGGPG